MHHSARTNPFISHACARGKSSLLNALLDESSVLPTSGSRGCTAAVVELAFNGALLEAPEVDEAKVPVPVYYGEVEFMKKDDWDKELKLLCKECVTDKGQLYTKKPNEKVQPAACAAWEKINQGGLGLLLWFSDPCSSSDIILFHSLWKGYFGKVLRPQNQRRDP